MQKKTGPSIESKMMMSLDEIAEKSGRNRGRHFKKSKPEERGSLRGEAKVAASAASSGNEKKKVYVENLNYKTSWQDLKDHMKIAGNVERADLFTRQSGASKGCGYS